MVRMPAIRALTASVPVPAHTSCCGQRRYGDVYMQFPLYVTFWIIAVSSEMQVLPNI